MKTLCNVCNKKRDERFIKTLEDGTIACEKCLRVPVFIPKSKSPERNSKCPCGSEKKYKKCCYQIELAQRAIDAQEKAEK